MISSGFPNAVASEPAFLCARVYEGLEGFTIGPANGGKPAGNIQGDSVFL
jgi:hypothetical protein